MFNLRFILSVIVTVGLAGSGIYLHHAGYTSGKLDAERVAFVAARKQEEGQAGIVERMDQRQRQQAKDNAKKLDALRKEIGPCLDRRIPAGVLRQLR